MKKKKALPYLVGVVPKRKRKRKLPLTIEECLAEVAAPSPYMTYAVRPKPGEAIALSPSDYIAFKRMGQYKVKITPFRLGITLFFALSVGILSGLLLGYRRFSCDYALSEAVNESNATHDCSKTLDYRCY